MGAKKSIGKWTLAALAAYELTLAGISLTPVAGKGTSFGEPAMWRNLVLIAAFYLIPLIFYYLHIEVMRYILAASGDLLDYSYSFFHTDIRRAFLIRQVPGGLFYLHGISYCYEYCRGKSAASDPLVCKVSGEKKKT